jgi:oxygen-dependent protoporphyrinogen oxidase
MKRIAIVGGGISGLTCGFRLEQQRASGAALETVLFEASPRFGGVIKTDLVEDAVFEAGPDSFLTEKAWATELCRELGLEDQLITSRDAQRTTFIVVGGRLLPIPEGLVFIVPSRLAPTLSSRLFSSKTKLRILNEWLHPPPAITEDMTVRAFVERHYGREMVERIADPLLAGVYGGSADELSVRAVLPRLVDMEAKHGSLGRAVLAARKASSVGPKPLFTSLKNGMQQLVDALLIRIPERSHRLGVEVEAVAPESGKWLVVSSGRRTEEFDAVVIATPAVETAKLLDPLPDVVAELKAIDYSSSITVLLEYDQAVRAALPTGFGFLVPRLERRRLLGATFVHNKFPHRIADHRALVRCFLGGTRDPDIVSASDDAIQKIVESNLAEILAVRTRPIRTRIYRWEKAMAQYAVGHLERIERIRTLLIGMPGLALAGNAYTGIGVPNCIRSGSEAANKVLGELGFASTTGATQPTVIGR